MILFRFPSTTSVNYHVRSIYARQDYDSSDIAKVCCVFDERGLIAGSQMGFLSVGWNQVKMGVWGAWGTGFKKQWK